LSLISQHRAQLTIQSKGRIERPFDYVEGNFLAGRSFRDWDDLNAQAVAWCHEVANAKPKRALGMSPEAAYLVEKPHLLPLPEVLPPVYELLDRGVDLAGYVSVDTNRYSVPERFVGKAVVVYKLPAEIRICRNEQTVDTNRYSVPERFVGKAVVVYKLPAEIRICRNEQTIAVHPRLIGQRDARSTLPGHHAAPHRESRQARPQAALLLAEPPSLARYAAALKERGNGWGSRALRRLIELKRTYPSAPFIAAVDHALHYGMFDLGRLEALILERVAGDFFALEDGEREDGQDA
jgi:hypothetical protein